MKKLATFCDSWFWYVTRKRTSHSQIGKSHSTLLSRNINLPFVIYLLLICTWLLDYLVWKIQFDELDFLSSSILIFVGFKGTENQILELHCSKDIIHFGINLNPGWRIVLRLLEQWQNFESMNTRPNHWINLSIYKKLKYKAE